MKTIFILVSAFFIASSANALPIDPSNYSNLGTKDDGSQKLHDEAVELESVLISTMIEPMFPDGKESGLYGGGHGSDIFRQMMVDQYARSMAQSNSLGIAKNIEKEIKNKGK